MTDFDHAMLAICLGMFVGLALVSVLVPLAKMAGLCQESTK